MLFEIYSRNSSQNLPYAKHSPPPASTDSKYLPFSFCAIQGNTLLALALLALKY